VQTARHRVRRAAERSQIVRFEQLQSFGGRQSLAGNSLIE
jgi:hypothetical protein